MTPPPGQFDIPPEHVTTGQLYLLLQQLSVKQSLVLQEQVRFGKRIEAQEEATRDMIAAWKAGGTVLRIVKWAALVGTAALSIWKFVKGIHV